MYSYWLAPDSHSRDPATSVRLRAPASKQLDSHREVIGSGCDSIRTCGSRSGRSLCAWLCGCSWHRSLTRYALKFLDLSPCLAFHRDLCVFVLICACLCAGAAASIAGFSQHPSCKRRSLSHSAVSALCLLPSTNQCLVHLPCACGVLLQILCIGLALALRDAVRGTAAQHAHRKSETSLCRVVAWHLYRFAE